MGEPEPAQTPVVIWEPQSGPQTALITCPVFEVVYGGARGGGKTDGVLGDWINHADIYAEHARGLMVRRKRTQLSDTIRRAQELFLPLGAEWKEQSKTFIMPNGATLIMAYLENDRDAEEYQGHSYTRFYPEELTNFPDSGPIQKLKATLRSVHGVKVGMRATCNPGGPGHLWVKARYIDPAPQGWEILIDEGLERVFIPAKLQDNPKLLSNDPQYVDRLKQSGSEQLVKAWLEGDWNIVEGAYFDCWSDQHVIKPCKLPWHWLRFRSCDWGSARPFSVGWWTVASEDFIHPAGLIPKGSLVRYREWYGASEPNVGLKMTAEAVAKGILEREDDETITYGVADPSIFAEDGGPSIAHRMGGEGIWWKKADNKRVPEKGRMGGWDQMRARFNGEDGRPLIYTFSTCADSIRTIPALQHDTRRPEDLDTEAEDHAADEWRYACMSRPWIPVIHKNPEKDAYGWDSEMSNWKTM